MAEVKNAFIKSKMNKDLDDRLIPSGEYRDAQNVQISRSEGSDVGALENVLGNKEILFSSSQVSFATLVGAPNIKCIGQFVDENKTTIYSFWTDYFDVQADNRIIYSPTAKNYILAYSTSGSDNYKVLVEGAFLNFSQTNPIIGVNIIEGLLFWTDNRNQPRKINVNLANTALNPSATYAVPTYYTVEDSISVAKYNPYECIQVLKASTLTAAEVTTGTTDGSVDNSKTIILTAIGAAPLTVGLGIVADATNGVTSGTIITDVDVAGTTITTNKANNIASGVVLTFSGLETTMYDVTSALLPDGTTANPYLETDYGGDPQFLEDKFVRFSYRFRFDDGEYSIFAPFTQPMFIPKQDGYFINDDEKLTFESTIVKFMENKVTKIDLLIPLPSTRLALQTIDTSAFKITEIDILYKESDGQAIRVVDTIKVENSAPWSDNLVDDVFIYSYESTKPYKTLPESSLIRVYDRVPVRAKAQELVSNRIVYGNFQDKHTPPASLDYQVGVSDKSATNVATGSQTRVEYPNHSVKQNRNYQVGIVLSDKFGRQSSAILSNSTAPLALGQFGADTVYSPYNPDPANAAAWPGDSLKVLFNETINSNSPATTNRNLGTPGLYNEDKTSASYNPTGWYSYKIVVKQQEQEYYNVYSAGAMKGLPYDYNASFPGQPGGNNSTSFMALINDNINKVPRDLTEVGPQDQTFRSSVRLFGRVENTANVLSTTGNTQFYPGRNSFTTNSVEALYGLFDVLQFDFGPGSSVEPITSTDNPFHGFFKSDANPFMAEFITSSDTTLQFGVLNDYNTTTPNNTFKDIENLAVFETEPDVSRLDIYWETSTSGLISELNTAVATDTGGAQTTGNFSFVQNEGMASGTAITTSFYGEDIIGARLPGARIKTALSDNEWSVIDGAGTNVTSNFALIETGTGTTLDPFGYVLQTANTFYYGPNATTLGNFTFSFTYRLWDPTTNPPAYIGTASTTPPSTAGQLTNLPPTIDQVCPLALAITTAGLPTVTTLTGQNGSADTARDTEDLVWEIVSQTQNGSAVTDFVMTTTNNQGVLTAASAAATYILVVKVTDAGGASATCTLNITVGQPEVPNRFKISSMAPLFDGDGVRYYFANNYTTLDQITNAISQSFAWITSSTNPLVSPATSNSTEYKTYNCPAGSVADYVFLREKLSAGLGTGEGAFYVQFYANAPTTTSGTTTQTFNPVSAVVEYRADSTANWTVAIDVDGTTTNAKAQYNGAVSGVPTGEGGMTNIGGNDNEMTLAGTTGGTSGVKRVFAFDIPGEYRITMGALNGQVCNFNNCTLTKSFSPQQGFTTGDYSYAGGVSTPQQYQYNVNGSTYYAKEHITKYVTQLYTDLALTTAATLTQGTYTFFRPNVNWEYTKNGSYTADFNSSAQRTNASTPVLYP